MKRITKLFVLITFLSGSMSAQKLNVFYSRDFWKANPSIKVIDEKIAEGNDISQLNSNAFDAVVYAILEETDNKTIIYILSKPGNNVNKKHTTEELIFFGQRTRII